MVKHSTKNIKNLKRYKTTPQGYKLQDGPILKRFRSSLVNISKLCSSQMLTDAMCACVFNTYDQNKSHRGEASAIKIAKDHFNCVVKIVSGDRSTSAHWGHLDRYGIPKVLRPLRRHILSKHPGDIRALLTLLSHYRAMQSPGEIDLSPITKGGVEIDWRTASRVASFAPKFLGRLKLSSIHQPSLCYTTKAGPNGPGLLTAWDDLASLKKDPSVLRNLWVYLSRFKDNPLQEGELSLIANILATFDSIPIPVTKQVYHSRLSVKREYGGKDRVFAISDYYSKMALKPFHDKVANILRGIPEDYTFDQDRAAAWIKRMQKEGVSLFSYDLTNATDRFPISVQQMVVWRLTKDRVFSDNWRNLVSDRGFTFQRRSYRYEVGQPMGFYSSWPVFALTHHCVVREAAKRSGVRNPRYALLGDDIVVEDRIAVAYRNLLSEFGVDISEGKSLKGEWTEFAKRIFVRGDEVTPLPARLIKQSLTDPLVLGALMDHWLRHPSISRSWEDQFRSLFAALALKDHQRRKYDTAAMSLSLWMLLQKEERETSLASLATDPLESLLDSHPEGRNGGKYLTLSSLSDLLRIEGFKPLFRRYVNQHKFENLLAAISKLAEDAPRYEEQLSKLLTSCESTGSADNHPARVVWQTYLRDLRDFTTEIKERGKSFNFYGNDGQSPPRPKTPNLDVLTRQSKVAQGRVDLQTYIEALQSAEENAWMAEFADEADGDSLKYDRDSIEIEISRLQDLLDKHISNA